MKTVTSHNTELGYELIATLPYAFWLHRNGQLEGTQSAIGSEAFYYFSPDHRIDPSPRDFAHTVDAAREIPNMWIHKPMLDLSKWEPPPYRDHYAKRAITFDKPSVVIYNRYNKEWDRDPINYFDLPVLRDLFDALLPCYDIVYFNVRGQESLEDNAHSMDLGDFEMIRSEYPQVRIIHDLVMEHEEDYNTVQLRVFAGCRKFITMNGAPSILASYFGGENIIYTRKCREIDPHTNSFYNWYHLFGGSDIAVVHSYHDLLRMVENRWTDPLPRINILIRCHDRKEGLKNAVESIVSQGYPNTRIIACYDNRSTWEYLRTYPFTKISVNPVERYERPDGDEYKSFLGPNVYFNQMQDMVGDGYIMYLDDDDQLMPGALWVISQEVNDKPVLFFRVNVNGVTVPSDEYFGQVVAGQISGLGIVFHNQFKELARWEPWRRGDYRVAKALEGAIGAKWIDKILSSTAEKLDVSQSRVALAEMINRKTAEVMARRLEIAKQATG
jgi:hypothetical protein